MQSVVLSCCRSWFPKCSYTLFHAHNTILLRTWLRLHLTFLQFWLSLHIYAYWCMVRPVFFFFTSCCCFFQTTLTKLYTNYIDNQKDRIFSWKKLCRMFALLKLMAEFIYVWYKKTRLDQLFKLAGEHLECFFFFGQRQLLV